MIGQRLLRVGLTGGIGSGKSTVATLLEMLGAAIYIADERAKSLMTSDLRLVAGIRELFGAGAYGGDGTLDRSYLAERIFGDRELRERLNALVHPAVARDFERWVGEIENAPYVVEEAAVLVESGGVQHVDVVVVVAAAQAIRLRRVVRRDGLTPQAAHARAASQLGDAERLAAAHYLLVADDRELLIPQVVALHAELCRLARSLPPNPSAE